MARKTALDVTVLSVGGTDLLGYWKSLDFTVTVQSEDGKGSSSRYSYAVATKKKFEFSLDHWLVSSAVRQTNLNITVFSVGGTSYLGDLDTGSIDIKTNTQDGSGAADLWETLNAAGTNITIKATKFVTTSPEIMAIAAANSISGLPVTVNFTLGGYTYSAPMLLTAASHKIDGGKCQMEDITFELRGTPTTSTGDTGVVDVVTGDAIVTVNVTFNDATTDGTYSFDAMILSTTVSFGNKQISSVSHKLQSQGAPTFQAAA